MLEYGTSPEEFTRVFYEEKREKEMQQKAEESKMLENVVNIDIVELPITKD